MKHERIPMEKITSIIATEMNQQTTRLVEQGKYREADRVISNKMKGNKIHMSQYRQKQQLKNQVINSHNSVRIYLNNFCHGYVGNHEQNSLEESDLDTILKSQRPKTTGIHTADPSQRHKRRIFEEDLDAFRNNRTMMVTSSGTRPKSISFRSKVSFTSNNLDNKTNQYMNHVIRNENIEPFFNEKIIDRIGFQGMVPHSRKINSFERQMKKSRKMKSRSKDKNFHLNSLDLKQISKSLEPDSLKRGPLVSNLSMKTTLGPLGVNNMAKRQYFHRNQLMY